jgi:hypothetical protein
LVVPFLSTEILNTYCGKGKARKTNMSELRYGPGYRNGGVYSGQYRTVDQRLKDIMGETAHVYTGLNGGTITASPGPAGGWRPASTKPGIHSTNHQLGTALDINYAPQGQAPRPNYQSTASFPAYEDVAQTAKKVQEFMHPELNNDFRWGGYIGGPKGKYGANDEMHFDTRAKKGMLGGTWDNGLRRRSGRRDHLGH